VTTGHWERFSPRDQVQFWYLHSTDIPAAIHTRGLKCWCARPDEEFHDATQLCTPGYLAEWVEDSPPKIEHHDGDGTMCWCDECGKVQRPAPR